MIEANPENDEFTCERCSGVFDIEDSVKVGDAYLCSDCAEKPPEERGPGASEGPHHHAPRELEGVEMPKRVLIELDVDPHDDSWLDLLSDLRDDSEGLIQQWRVVGCPEEPIKAKQIAETHFDDPDSGAPVHIGIFKMETGPLVGLDASYLEQDVGTPHSPYDPAYPLDIEE